MIVSIVIINFNSTDHTIKCVKSVFDKTNTNIEVIIVDNNSNIEEREKLTLWHKYNKNNINLVESRKNTGFAMGNMQGANYAKGDYLFFLNNDCILLNNAIDKLLHFMEKNQEVGLAGPKIFNSDGKHTPSFNYIPTVANKWLGSSVCRFFNEKNYPSRKKQYTSPLAVQMISGSAMFIRRSCFSNLGGLDTNFFLYCEEEDISIRTTRQGYKIYYVPEAEITHYCGASTKRNLDIEKEFYISLYYLLNKNYSFISRNLIKVRYIIKELLKLIKGKGSFSLLYFLITGPTLGKSMRHKMKYR